MQFDWDGANINHIARHQVLPDEAEQVLANNPFEADVLIRNREARIICLGETNRKRILVVIVTLRDEKVRVVTARPANRKERGFYAESKARHDENSQNP